MQQATGASSLALMLTTPFIQSANPAGTNKLGTVAPLRRANIGSNANSLVSPVQFSVRGVFSDRDSESQSLPVEGQIPGWVNSHSHSHARRVSPCIPSALNLVSATGIPEATPETNRCNGSSSSLRETRYVLITSDLEGNSAFILVCVLGPSVEQGSAFV